MTRWKTAAVVMMVPQAALAGAAVTLGWSWFVGPVSLPLYLGLTGGIVAAWFAGIMVGDGKSEPINAAHALLIVAANCALIAVATGAGAMLRLVAGLFV